MYLHDEMEDMKRFSRPMVGFVRGRVYQSEAHGRHIGYIELTAAKDQMLGAKGTTIKAHEYHYFGSTDCGNSFHARNPSCSTEWECMELIPSPAVFRTYTITRIRRRLSSF